ncbi:MAG TPA: hypothetical protein VER17_15035, partial [Tepidisphaeraceae bacterium]|nr:hypothetical protein [Tepidisphaeraceae bacterium]
MRRGASVPAVTIGIIAAAGWAVVGGVVVVGTVGGCRSASPPPRVAVPSHADGSPEITYRHDPVKPMPAPGGRAADDELAGAQFDDPPLVTQRPPEQRAFVEAYNRVGRPRMAVLVNPVLAGGSQDELQARAIDYAAMETILADWIGANGQVTLISPTAARQRLSPEQVRDLQTSGSTTSPAAQQVAQDLNADVFVQVRVEPTRQANQPAARIVSEAVNARGGQSVARAVVDVPPPLEKTQINRYTRFVARKLMDDMTGAWSTMPGPAASGASGESQAMPPQQQSMPVQRQSAAPPSSPPSDSGFAAPAPQQPPLAQPPAP